jgi:hypothetical protein
LAGAYALRRNPAGHREVDYDDVSERHGGDGKPSYAHVRGVASCAG